MRLGASTIRGYPWHASRKGPGDPFDYFDLCCREGIILVHWGSNHTSSARRARSRPPRLTCLIVTKAEQAPALPDGWVIEPAVLPDGFEVNGGVWNERVKLVRVLNLSHRPPMECEFDLDNYPLDGTMNANSS